MKFKELPEEVENYLDKYSLPDRQIEINNPENIFCVVVIPSIAEYENIKRLLLSLIENDSFFFPSTLFLYVVNNLQSSPNEIKSENKNTINLIKNILRQKEDDDFVNSVLKSGLRIGLVDASSPGKELPEKDGGVGVARKIGMDAALKLFDYKKPGKKILVCLDADCLVEKNYLSTIYNTFNSQDIHAAYINFNHILPGNVEEELAIICYEIFIRYYVLGLKIAHSQYSFPTVGSTIVCDYKSYIKVEGMNKRKAAEDFYFMEKLAKNYSIKKISLTTVYPLARQSKRVPFGTGQRISRFLSHAQDEYFVYAPQTFFILKKWLEVFNDEPIKSAREYLENAMNIHPSLYNFLISQKFEQSWEKIRANHKREETLWKQKIFWFDGFKTMKLIHYLRDNGFPLSSMFLSINELLNVYDKSIAIDWNNSDIPPIEIQKKILQILQNIT